MARVVVVVVAAAVQTEHKDVNKLLLDKEL
jgi:hypothetical protein